MQRPLSYRILRFGLRVASRAAGDVVDRAMQRNAEAEAPEVGPRRFGRRKALEPVAVRFVAADGREVSGEVERGISVLDAARLLDVDIAHYCGGNCSCGTCRIGVGEGSVLSRQHPNERMALGAEASASGQRLACQARLEGPAHLTVPDLY